MAYGNVVGNPELFFQHTYLTIVAKSIATIALSGTLPSDPERLLRGSSFQDLGIIGAVESDFFDWILLSPGGRQIVAHVSNHVARFDLSRVDVDILKVLYESLIDPVQRHDLGEYYTPDWLADRMVVEAVDDPLNDRVIDPACGSGTFLFHAVRRAIQQARAAGLAPHECVALACEKVAGVDVHPVAVIFARATYLLALAPTLREGRPAAVIVPVYLGDALQWSAREMMGVADLEIVVPAEGEAAKAASTGKLPEDEEGEAGRRAILRFPFEMASDPGMFDATLDQMLLLGERQPPVSELRKWLRKEKVPGEATLLDTYGVLKELQRQGRNHIWGYVARNLSRPIWLASEIRRADVVIGNPPWLAYARMARSTQQRFREEMKTARLWAGVKSVSAYDLSAYFFTRCVQLYMREHGRIAFVMPYAAMSRDPYKRFRSGTFRDRAGRTLHIEFTNAWTFPADVSPLFPVPSCVLFAQRSKNPKTLPRMVKSYAGHLPKRDAHAEEASRSLAESEQPWPSDDGTARVVSHYRDRFRQGAILIPRRFVLVERLPTGRLGGNPAAPLLRGRVGNQDKEPWKSVLPPEGPVEATYVRKVILGESIAPFRVLSVLECVIPWSDEAHALLTVSSAQSAGAANLARWLERIDGLWKEHGRGARTFNEQLDYWEQLSSQFPLQALRVCYAKAGKNPAAVVIDSQDVVVDHKLYWAKCDTISEARYISCILNSEAARVGAERWQSQGQWGARDFDKVMFRLPIPRFKPGNPIHESLVSAAERAEALAADVPIQEGIYFTRARAKIRDALREVGLAEEIDELVSQLLP